MGKSRTRRHKSKGPRLNDGERRELAERHTQALALRDDARWFYHMAMLARGCPPLSRFWREMAIEANRRATAA